ncbi:hypothetical protein QBC33DRAFT_289312 [Phialemonium atrogriseum]|uniref:Uncharacterized protein n=1 Tax=Phialemonium atrogriseum TaxID=1093897 RepID=A0AAJ0FB68_9PEZI|nr:uncharacterized protein QBC33DRAFT_289312 [Phialemonium atrogriseum]KAK1762161.1 hypothetical protein QBC33DRAFT_289312 [Phialemonium atrogriseum]
MESFWLRYVTDSTFPDITPLHDGQDSVIDIVALPGLGSHPIGSFQAKGGDQVWLRDFLHKDIPNARILLYGYNTAIQRDDARYSIQHLAKSFLDSFNTFRGATNVMSSWATSTRSLFLTSCIDLSTACNLHRAQSRRFAHQRGDVIPRFCSFRLVCK